MFISLPFRMLHTSKYKGSPVEPASLVLSKTAIFLTDSGKTFKKYSLLNGRYK